MAQIIFASHGELSKGMKNSVSMIVGDLSSDVETFSLFPGQNPRDYYQQLLKRVQETDEQFIILTDIKGGSVHTALMPLTQMDNVILLSGMNLVMALDVLLRYKNNIEQSDFDELLHSAKSGITLRIQSRMRMMKIFRKYGGKII